MQRRPLIQASLHDAQQQQRQSYTGSPDMDIDTDTNAAQLPKAQAELLQGLFLKKYGLRVSIEYWIKPVYLATLHSGGSSAFQRQRAASVEAIFAKLESAFLNEDLRRCIPPQPDAQQGGNSKATVVHYLIDRAPADAEADLRDCVRQSNFMPDMRPTSVPTAVSVPVPTTFQIIDVVEIGVSKYEQLRRLEDGMTDGGRRIIRDLPSADGDDDSAQMQQQQQQAVEAEQPNTANSSSSSAVQFHMFESNGKRKPLIGKANCKALLQDALGRVYWAIEQKPIPAIQVGLKLGCKITVTASTTCLRGVILLKPGGTVLHGGVVEEWNVRFRERLMMRLQGELGLADEQLRLQREETQQARPHVRTHSAPTIGDRNKFEPIPDVQDSYFLDDEIDEYEREQYEEYDIEDFNEEDLVDIL